MIASTCPYCGAETRPGDNFCLNCGNRLLSATPSPEQQAEPVIGESTLPAQEGWAQPMQGQSSIPASPGSGATWTADASAPTIASTSPEPPTSIGPNVGVATAATVERPARFILRADNGDVLQEYPLEKAEISIGRAPTSDILLSKDKLTSRRHATVLYENGTYTLRDERSANGTFVNGQQLEEMATHVLKDGDHIGIGEHELIFHGFGTSASSPDLSGGVADMPTVSVPYSSPQELTYRTREDELVTSATSDDFSTKSMENGAGTPIAPPPVSPTPVTPVPVVEDVSPPPVVHQQSTPDVPAAASPVSSQPMASDIGVTFGRLTSIPQPSLPDMAPLLAALSTLDGQVMSLQEQLNATQEAVRNHETEVAQITNQLRSGVRHVSDRMDNTIADVARNREALAWADLIQLMEDVQNSPKDIDNLTRLGRKARELNKVFQIHQNVLNTLAECNSLLRSLIGEDRTKS
jgi:pSer/pThr/pTyr-binding forkhead associated (FHA) protein